MPCFPSCYVFHPSSARHVCALPCVPSPPLPHHDSHFIVKVPRLHVHSVQSSFPCLIMVIPVSCVPENTLIKNSTIYCIEAYIHIKVTINK